MTTMKLLFISISGNTRAFANKLVAYAQAQNEADTNAPLITLEEVSDAMQLEGETTPYFAMVPTYLDGGNGIDNGVKELMTNALGEYLEEPGNGELCLGIIGSGNKNFNEQYCLTARRYADNIDAPFIADYELRGTEADAKRIYTIMREVAKL